MNSKCQNCGKMKDAIRNFLEETIPEETVMTPPFLRFGKGLHETQLDRFACRKDAQEIQEFRDFAEKAILIYVLHRNQLQFANFHFDSF